jgi:dTDP-4-amino-4,6-dideoxygalactose transaminase
MSIMNTIPFNKPYATGNEIKYIAQAIDANKIAGDGMFTKKCHQFFEEKYGFKKALLTTSCTDALEMAAILLDIKQGDEVILPSFTFVSTANAFALRGATLVFADSCSDNPNIDPTEIEKLITKNTKAIVVVHYAGVACDMGRIMAMANAAGIAVVEDAAQAIDSYYMGKPLGSIGTFGAFSFHETKNIIAGEGGMLVINDEKYIQRAEIIREKGTNRSSFFRGEVDKYGWVDIGSSFLPSDMIAAYLYAQLENLDEIQSKRKAIWNQYHSILKPLSESCKLFKVSQVDECTTNNAHMYYLICNDLNTRTKIIENLKKENIHAVFHYLSLHSSKKSSEINKNKIMVNSDRYTNCLLRLPLYYEMDTSDVLRITTSISKTLRLNAN